MTTDTLDVLPATSNASPLTQPPLPFARDALAPAISAETIGFHYDKHHKGYFTKLNELVEGTAHAGNTLEEIILATAGDSKQKKLFNNAAQAWNHNFYWASLSPAKQTPSGMLAKAIVRDFGSLDELKAALTKASVDQFGTGWGWLVSTDGKLSVLSTDDAEVPFTDGRTPLLTVDVWEHAYYLDYQNRRPDHVKAIVDNHLNWEFAAANYGR